MAKKNTCKKLTCIFVIVAMIAILSGIYYYYLNATPSKKEGLIPSKTADVTAILNDETLSPETQMNILGQLGIQDPIYNSIINDTKIDTYKKVEKMKEIINTQSSGVDDAKLNELVAAV
jgi:hypothetical protein